MKIAIIGHGYVGLVTAAVFSDLGNTVWCVGRTAEKINNLINGVMPFFEPGLEEVVKKNVASGRLRFTLKYEEAVPDADIVFICVGTPSTPSGEADLSSVFESAKNIAKNLNGYTVVACKSTVPVGTNRKVAVILKDHKSRKATFDIASCPEFLREGTALFDTLNPDRIVVGADNKKASDLLLELHKPINGHFVVTTIETSEMIKYAANTLLATKISFANAMSFLCEKVGADVEKVMDGIGHDRRIGRAFLSAGVGYGGSCFPKDVKALIAMTKQYKTDGALFESVETVNKLAHQHFTKRVVDFFQGNLKGVKIGILGLAFKPDTDDMRAAPSISIINELAAKGVIIKAYDPKSEENSRKILGNKITFAANVYEVCEKADCILIITEWNEFKQLDLAKIKKMMAKPVIFDGRNVYEPEKLDKMGFTYFSVGR